MRSLRILIAAIIAGSGFALAPLALSTSASAEDWIGRSVTLAGRKLQCGRAEIMVDRELPSEGGAGDDFLILNPDMLNQQPSTVRLFVFSHECGHLSVGDSELDADCFAVKRGVREGWLDRKGLTQVCNSFEGAPETETHPSAARRCRNLDRCFAAAQTTATASTSSRIPDLPVRKRLAAAPQKALSAWRCTTQPGNAAASVDADGKAAKDGSGTQPCR